MKYFLVRDRSKKEITYEQALDRMLGAYKDSDMTRDMLTIPNRIWLGNGYSYISVEQETEYGQNLVLMAGLWNDLPDGVAYDDDCNRI